mgnify:CR=1 FL=1
MSGGRYKKIDVGGFTISNDKPFVLIAGLNVLEEEKTILEVISRCKQSANSLDIPYIFKASYDKANRSSFDSYRGPGPKKGLEILFELKKEFDVPVISDIHTPAEAEMASDVLDIIQIPAFLSRQTDLIKAACETSLPLNIKKGQFMSAESMKHAVTKIKDSGNNHIMLTDRGTMFGYQDIIAIGKLFKSGYIDNDRIVSLAGPQVNSPSYIRTRLGASTDEITAGELTQRENRIISGSIISGREAIVSFAYLGRYHNQISVIAEPNSKDREFMNWLTPGPRKFSKMPVFLSSLFPKKVFKFKALMNGSDRPIVPIGSYEEVLPFNMLPIMLLRNIVLLDTEKLQALGGLELDEEDLSLCSYICPGKYDFGSLLRAGLTKIEVEG